MTCSVLAFSYLSQQAMDIREETPDMTAIRIFGCLRVLKYKPPTEYVHLFIYLPIYISYKGANVIGF